MRLRRIRAGRLSLCLTLLLVLTAPCASQLLPDDRPPTADYQQRIGRQWTFAGSIIATDTTLVFRSATDDCTILIATFNVEGLMRVELDIQFDLTDAGWEAASWRWRREFERLVNRFGREHRVVADSLGRLLVDEWLLEEHRPHRMSVSVSAFAGRDDGNASMVGRLVSDDFEKHYLVRMAEILY
jgi:hypothetical protein